MDALVARQPILDRKGQLYAYELLYRATEESETFGRAEAACATSQVLASSMLSIGFDKLLCDKKAFINFDRTLIMSGLLSVLPRDQIVIEILETVEPDADLIAVCRQLAAEGYQFALDDFIGDPRTEPLTEIAKLIKVDLRETTRAAQAGFVEKYKARGITMLAEKVETHEEFEWSREAGFELFQGYFFARPALVRGRQIPAFKLPHLQLLAEVHKAELDFARIADIIRVDPSLCYKLLRYSNSGMFYFRSEIRSLNHAITVLGEAGIRHWVALATLPVLAKDKPGELATHAVVRARFCELTALRAGLADPGQSFLMGLVSLLDAFVDVPIKDVLAQMHVCSEIQAAVLGETDDNSMQQTVYRLACRYEEGDWTAVSQLARQMGIPIEEVSDDYAHATVWVQRTLGGSFQKPDGRRHRRQAISAFMQISWNEDETKLSWARLVNISRAGVQIEVRHPIAAGVLVCCTNAPLGLAGTGLVRYCNPLKDRYLVGLEFSDSAAWCEAADLLGSGEMTRPLPAGQRSR